MEISQLAILFGVGAVAGFININAGGGSSLTLPTLIFLGLDGALANGTNRVAIFVQNLFGVASFRKQKVQEFPLSFKLSLLPLPGAVIGAIAATKISSILFQRILAVVLVFIVISLLFSRKANHSGKNANMKHGWLVYPSLFGIGFYGGFLQIGVGFLLMGALFHFLEKNLVRVNMHKVFIVMVYTVPALIIFALTGNINWKYGLVLAAGNALGAWWGVLAAVKGGERIIRIILSAAILMMAGKLLDLF